MEEISRKIRELRIAKKMIDETFFDPLGGHSLSLEFYI
jgi:hypothetical protein